MPRARGSGGRRRGSHLERMDGGGPDAYLRLNRQYLEDLRAQVEALRGPQNGGRA